MYLFKNIPKWCAYLSNKTMVVVTHRSKIKEICTKAYKFNNSVLGKEEIL